MRQAVVVIETADLDGRVLVWTGLVGHEIICIMPPKARRSHVHRQAAEEMIKRITKNTNIEPVWPWESDAISEG